MSKAREMLLSICFWLTVSTYLTAVIASQSEISNAGGEPVDTTIAAEDALPQDSNRHPFIPKKVPKINTHATHTTHKTSSTKLTFPTTSLTSSTITAYTDAALPTDASSSSSCAPMTVCGDAINACYERYGVCQDLCILPNRSVS